MRRSRFLGTFFGASRARARQCQLTEPILLPNSPFRVVRSSPTSGSSSSASSSSSSGASASSSPAESSSSSSSPRRTPLRRAESGVRPDEPRRNPGGCRAFERFSRRPSGAAFLRAGGRRFSRRDLRAAPCACAVSLSASPSARRSEPFFGRFLGALLRRLSSSSPRSLPPVARPPPGARIIQSGSCRGVRTPRVHRAPARGRGHRDPAARADAGLATRLAAVGLAVAGAALAGAARLGQAWEAGFKRGDFGDFPLPLLIS